MESSGVEPMESEGEGPYGRTFEPTRHPIDPPRAGRDRELFIDYLLDFIIVMIRKTGLAPLQLEFPVPGSLTSTILCESPGLLSGVKRGGAH